MVMPKDVRDFSYRPPPLSLDFKMERNMKILPTEVLISIINSLEYERHTLYQLTLVSHAVNELATPLLYRSYQDPSTQDKDAFRRFYSYLRTILGNTHLAHHVKHVSLCLSPNNATQKANRGAELRGLIDSRIKSICSTWLEPHIGKASCKEWLHKSKIPKENCLAILLLCCLPNLETMFLQEDFNPRVFEKVLAATMAAWKSTSMSAVSTSDLPLAKLQSIRCWCSKVYTSWSSFYGLGTFFCLPSLRSIEIAMAHDNSRNGVLGQEQWELAKRSSHVERLSLQGSEINALFMRCMVRSCIGLKEFHFTYSHNMSGERLFYPQELLKELLGHAHTLEVLRINYDDSQNKTDWEMDVLLNTNMLKFSKDLAKLKKLKHLAVNHSVVFGNNVDGIQLSVEFGAGLQQLYTPRSAEFRLSDYLPPNLEELEIFSCGSGVLPHFQHLAEIRKHGSRFENLKKVRLHMVDKATNKEDLMLVNMSDVEVDYLMMGSLESRALTSFSMLYCTTYQLGREDASFLFPQNPLMLHPRCDG